MSARIWEDTLVIALRDWQWMKFLESELEEDRQKMDILASSTDKTFVHYNSHSKAKSDRSKFGLKEIFPGGFLKMDGRSESRLGDVAVQGDGQRFFLLEVKSSQYWIRSEWVGADGKFKPKSLYEKLEWLVVNIIAAEPKSQKRSDLLKILNYSLRCHFFAYWGGVQSADDAPGNIFIESYIPAVMRRWDSADALKHLTTTIRTRFCSRC